jgi:drug/metabolite transporter (DMT)-like permease
VPFVLWSYAAPHVRSSVAGVAVNLIPIVGVLTAAVVGLGTPTAGQLAGGALILGGVALLSLGRRAVPDPAPDIPDRACLSVP